VNFTEGMYFSKPSESSYGVKGTHSVLWTILWKPHTVYVAHWKSFNPP